MREALDRLRPSSGVLRVSVARETRWERTRHGDEVHVRWLCWSIEDAGKEIQPPEFEVISPDVTQELLADELPAVFRDVQVVVDDDVDV